MIICSFFLSVSIYIILILSGGSMKTTLMWLCCSPMSTSISTYVVNVFVYDMYKEWNWKINILYLVLVACSKERRFV